MAMHENEIGTMIVDCAVHLHKDLGPGLLELVYEVTLAAKLRKRGLSVERQVPIAIEYEGQRFEEGFRADVIVEGKVIVEIKSVETVHPTARALISLVRSWFCLGSLQSVLASEPLGELKAY